MKTIAERAKEFAQNYEFVEKDMDCGNCNTCGKCRGYRKYVDIVTEQREIDIENACKWLKEHIYEYIAVGNTDFGKPYDIHLCDEELFEDFRNAMEE